MLQLVKTLIYYCSGEKKNDIFTFKKSPLSARCAAFPPMGGKAETASSDGGAASLAPCKGEQGTRIRGHPFRLCHNRRRIGIMCFMARTSAGHTAFKLVVTVEEIDH
jgi:hypothetical protein